MRTVPADFLEPHFNSTKTPVQVVEVDFGASDYVYFTSHSTVPTPDGFDVIPKGVKRVSGTSQKIDPSVGRSTIGNIKVDLLDISDALTTILKERDDAGRGIRHKRVRAYQGFENMTWAQLSTNLIQTQIITGLSEHKGNYVFSCSDIQRTARDKIFSKAKARLSASIDSTQLLIPVLTTDGFEICWHGSSYTDAPDTYVGYGLIDDEVIRYTGTTVDGSLGLCFVADQRGALNTAPAAHEVDPEDTSDRATYFEEFVYLELPAPKLIYALLTGVLYGDGEVLPSNWHLNISEDFVYAQDYLDAGDDLWLSDEDEGFILRFAGEKEQDGKKFIEQQICLLISAFLPVYSTGELGFKLATSVLHRAPYVFELNEDSVKEFSPTTFDTKAVHNLLTVKWNYDFLRDELTRQRIINDDLSRAKYGSAPALELSFRGLHGSRHTSAAVEALFDRLRDRFAAPPITMTLKCMPYTNFLEVGDIVRVNLSGTKDYFDGGKIDRAMEIQSVSVDWTSGDVSFNLFGSSRSAGLIAPSDPQNGTDPSSAIIPDVWYTANGTDLATYAGVDITVVGDVGHITGGSGIVGGANMLAGTYYYDGDLELDTGVVLPFTKNVQLRVKGHLQINGEFNGTGEGGLAAAALGYVDAYEETNHINSSAVPTPQFLKSGPSGGGHYLFDSYPGFGADNGLTHVVPPVSVRVANDFVYGLPLNLQGTGGATGRNWVLVDFNPPLSYRNIAGGGGGKGGAGLLITSRGCSFGVSGKIVSNGADGSQGANFTVPEFTDARGVVTPEATVYGGTGGGGACGAVIFNIDGIANSVPEQSHVETIYGASPYSPATPATTPTGGWNNDPDRYSYYVGYGISPPDLSGFAGGSRIVFVPPTATAIEDTLIAKPLTEVEWEDVKNSTGNKAEDGATAGATWGDNIASQPADSNLLNDQQEWNDVQDAGGTRPANNADVTDYDSTLIANNQTRNNVTTIPYPDGGAVSLGASNTGAIVITLPQSWTSTMLQFEVEVFHYVSAGSANSSFTAKVGGYNYTLSTQWINNFAQISGYIGGNNRVRFGHNGSNCVVVIGDTGDSHPYLKAKVKNFQAGFSNFTIAQWDDGWTVAVDNTLSGITFSGTDFSDALLDARATKLVGSTAAETVESNASTALSNAAAALAELDDIADDGLLTPVEKPQVIAQRDVIIAEQSGIDGRASAYSITTEKTAYDNAITALTSYLAGLTTPVLWSNLTGNTTIAGTTFWGKFNDVYTAKQTLLDKITEVVTAQSPQGAGWLTNNVVGDHNTVTNVNNDSYFDDDSMSADWSDFAASSEYEWNMSTTVKTHPGASPSTAFISMAYADNIIPKRFIYGALVHNTDTIDRLVHIGILNAYFVDEPQPSFKYFLDITVPAGGFLSFNNFYDFVWNGVDAVGSWNFFMRSSDGAFGKMKYSGGYMYAEARFK